MSLNERLIPIVEDGASYGAAPSLQKAKTDKKSVLTTGRVLAAVAGVAGVAGVAALSSNSVAYPGGLLGKSKDFEHVLHRQSKAFKGLAAARQEGIRMMAELTVRPIVNPGQPAHLGASEYEKCVDFNSKPAVYSKTDAGEVRLDLIYQNTREVATPVTAYADSERAVNAITCKEAPKNTFQEIGACTEDKSFCDSNCYMPVPGNCAAGAKEFGSCTPTVTSVCGSISDTSAGCQKVSSEVVTKEGQYNNMQPGVAPCDAAPKADAVAAQGKYKEAYNEWVNAVNDATEVCTVGHALWVHNSGMYEKHYDELVEVTADLQAMCDESSGENAFDFDKALAEAKKDNVPTVRRKLVWWQQLCEPTIESLKVLTASLEIVSPQLQCFAETCVAKRAAEVAAFTKLGQSHTAYKGAYDSYDAKATAYNTAVDDKNAQKEAVIAAYTAFHPTKDEAALTYNKDVAAFTRFDTGADKGHCGLSDCQIKAVCSTQITSKFDRFIKSDTCSAVPMSADKICSDGPVVEPVPVVDKGPECSGRTVTVKRMDPAGRDGHGWGMNLQFMCGDSRVNIGNSRGSQTQSTVVNTPMHKGDCAARINKSNWLGGYGYQDYFDVTVGECPPPPSPPAPVPVEPTCSRAVTARRLDANHGWGMNLRIKCGTDTVTIGNSDRQTKTVYSNAGIKGCPSNVDKNSWVGGDRYGDRFDITMGPCQSEPAVQCRRTVTATRLDANHGWGMNLRFRCGGQVVSIGNSHSRSRSTTTSFTMSDGQCPGEVNRGNWEGHDRYGDRFAIKVSGCIGAALGDAQKYDHEDKLIQ